MAKIQIVTTWQEAGAYLKMLKATVAADIRPLLDLPDHAPFAICREVLSYVDHLGHLYLAVALIFIAGPKKWLKEAGFVELFVVCWTSPWVKSSAA